jgi:ADP-heptose:LPS heptosyltransferase/GT2 family glycosyltransferase
MNAILVTIDQAEIAGGLLSVSGWAFGGAPIQAVEIHVPGVGRGEAQYGLPRADVAAEHPGRPEALASGFQFMASLAKVAVDVTRIQVVVRTPFGVAATLTVVVAQAERAAPTFDARLHFYCDRLALYEDGEVEISGWAAHPGEVERIEIRLDGALLGTAALGGRREDVGADLPHIPSAIHSGFDFHTQLPALDAGEHEVELAISTLSGERFVRSSKGATQVARGVAREGAGREDIRLEIDAPKIVYGKFAHPVRRLLTVSGWAIAREGLASVEAYLDGAPVGAVARGARRLDIAAAYPDFPDTVSSGFALVLPRKVFTKSSHRLKICARDRRGQVKEIEVGVEIAPADRDEIREPLRTFLPQAEIDMKMALIAASPLRAGFAVLILPGSDPDLDGLAVTLRSLADQAYPAFRAGFVASTRATAGAAQAVAAAAGVALAAIEPGLDLATAAGRLAGDLSDHAPFVVRLRAGDRLGADALIEFALEIATRPEEDFLYADDRRRGPEGRLSAFFKPEWSPDLLLSTNYIGRAWCAALALVERARVGVEAGDYDCVLRLSEQAAEIGRAPFVALEAGIGEAPREQRSALRSAAARRGFRAGVLATAAPDVWRLKRRVATRGLVSIVVPTIAARSLVETCLSSLRALTLYKNFEIVVLDNIADPASPWKDRLRQSADCVVECDEPFNWSRFNNLCAEAALGEFLLFLNDDVEAISPRWLHAMLEAAERPEVGVVGARLLYPDGRIQHAGMYLSPTGGRHAFRFADAEDVGPHGLAAATRNVAAVTGACLLVRRDVFDAVGGFDESHAIVNNDLDFCLKVWRSGRRVVYTPHATLVHHEAASRAGIGEVYDEAAFSGAWRNTFALGDPFLNPRLSRDDDDYAPEPEPTRVIVVGRPLLARENVRRILVQKLDHIGDFITGLPAIRRLKARFPQAEIHVLASAASAAIARLEPAIGQVIEFDFFHAQSQNGKLDIEESTFDALEARLRPYRFDIAIDLRKNAETRDILKRSGAKLLAGYDSRGAFPWLDVALEWEEDPPYLHKRAAVSDDFVALVEAVSIACERGATLAGPSPEAAVARLKSLPAVAALRPGLFARPLVGVHPGAGNVTKEWPPGHFAALIDLLVGAFDVDVALVGAGDEKALAEQVLEAVVAKDRVWSLVGLTGLADLPALVTTMRLFVGNNSGPQHIAAALGVPTVNVHTGIVSAREWGPVGPMAVALQRDMSCSPCYLEKASLCPRGLACLTGLPPGDVFAACERMLAPQMRGELASRRGTAAI